VKKNLHILKLLHSLSNKVPPVIRSAIMGYQIINGQQAVDDNQRE
jgi:hypothetical protein